MMKFNLLVGLLLTLVFLGQNQNLTAQNLAAQGWSGFFYPRSGDTLEFDLNGFDRIGDFAGPEGDVPYFKINSDHPIWSWKPGDSIIPGAELEALRLVASGNNSDSNSFGILQPGYARIFIEGPENLIGNVNLGFTRNNPHDLSRYFEDQGGLRVMKGGLDTDEDDTKQVCQEYWEPASFLFPISSDTPGDAQIPPISVLFESFGGCTEAKALAGYYVLNHDVVLPVKTAMTYNLAEINALINYMPRAEQPMFIIKGPGGWSLLSAEEIEPGMNLARTVSTEKFTYTASPNITQDLGLKFISYDPDGFNQLSNANFKQQLAETQARIEANKTKYFVSAGGGFFGTYSNVTMRGAGANISLSLTQPWVWLQLEGGMVHTYLQRDNDEFGRSANTTSYLFRLKYSPLTGNIRPYLGFEAYMPRSIADDQPAGNERSLKTRSNMDYFNPPDAAGLMLGLHVDLPTKLLNGRLGFYFDASGAYYMNSELDGLGVDDLGKWGNSLSGSANFGARYQFNG